MDDDKADAYVERALRWFTRERDVVEIVVALPSVPSVTRAFERRGWGVAPGHRPGRLRLRPPHAEAPPPAETTGARLLGAIREAAMTNRKAGTAMGATRAELALLRQERFAEIGAARLAEMARRFEES